MSEITEIRPRRYRLWIPVFLVAITAGVLAWLWSQEHMMAEIATYVLPFLCLILVALWWIFLTGMTWKWKGIFFVWFLFILGGLGALFRFDGSASGGMGLRFVPIWAPTLEELTVAPPVQSEFGAVTEVGVPDGIRDFPGYLGGQRTGVVDGIDLDPNWSENPPQEIWRLPIGLGWGGFSVQDGRAVTMEQRGSEELVTCYEVETGQLLWSQSVEARFSEPAGGDGPRSTPSIEGDRVYTQGATGLLHCLDLRTGEKIWVRDVLEDSGASKNLEWATTSSPLVYDGAVYAFGGSGNSEGRLLSYEASTGEPRWIAGQGDPSYASPSHAVIDGVSQILCTNAKSLSGHSIETGEELWNFPWTGAMAIKASQIQVLENGDLYSGAGYNLGSVRFSVKKNEAGEWTATEVWSSNRMKTKFSNASVRGKHAWGLDEGRFVCQDLETGDRLWKETRYGYGQQLLVGEHILVMAERGHLALIEARADEFREVALMEDVLTSKTWNPPTLAGEFLLIRNDREAVCLRVKLRSSAE